MKKQGYLKKLFGLSSLVMIGMNTYSIEAPVDSQGRWEIFNGNYEITTNANKSMNLHNYSALHVSGNSKLEIKTPLDLDIKVQKNAREDAWALGMLINGNNQGTPQIKAGDINLKMRPLTALGITETAGIEIDGGAKLEADNVNIDIVHQAESLRNPILAPHEDTIGILFTGSVDDLGGGNLLRYPERLTEAKINNSNIKVSNTKDSDSDILNYSMEGIVLQRYDNKSYNSKIEITGDLNIEISDISTKQNANKLAGINVFGEDTKLTMKNSKIVLKGEGKLEDSAAILIGDFSPVDLSDPNDPYYGHPNRNGLVESKGKMIIDTTEAPRVSAIYMRGNESKLDANFSGSSAEIKVGSTAITFGKKYGSFENNKYIIKEENASNQIVNLKDAIISSMELLPLSGGKIDALINVEEEVRNATLNLNGGKTKAVVTNIPLLFVGDGGDITFNVSDKAFVQGGVQNRLTGVSRVNISGEAIWKLPNVGLASNVTYTKLSSGGILDATAIDNTGGMGYTIKTYANKNELNFINDGGIITMANGKYDDKLIIHGNYSAKNGELRVNTLWNAPDKSVSDLLIIEGEAKGITNVKAVSLDGTENIIDGNVTKVKELMNSVPVVQVGKAKEGAFRGKAKTTGAGEVQLGSRINSDGEREFFWTTSKVTYSNEEKELYSAVVPAYTSTIKSNLDLGFTTIGTLYERRGENKQLTDKKGEAWVRVIGKNYENNGKERFNIDSEIYGVQTGYDFGIKENSKGILKTGFYIAHVTANNKFYDRYRAENGEWAADKYTGASKTKDLSFGITATKYYNTNTYLDLVGQFSILNNKYTSRDNEKAQQRGNSYLLSAELGKSYKLSDTWGIEPQVQLIYQYLKLKNFNDGVREVKYENNNSLRGRFGFKLQKNKYSKTKFYALANLWHDFQNDIETSIGRDKVKEKYSSTWGEVGIGLEHSLTQSTSIYGDIRHEKSFNSKTKYSSYRGTIGLKYSW
ncbi:MAG: autotransporter outer membrane beta-barrel domain-containing protein [Fusobacterium sp.]|uniref:autotransporter family protein n=1 Tax=Fusobacterium sp. TaxID=68766 RepID=UPI0026DCC170|nr:autotransporter outer membrane beta-barrel domain-containing protein [Fusobacterium sp.]MDO4690634.1 autotransporter outer membrane beta-barrel domain-containing protein [Fusobacterium sp.]